MEQLLLGLAFPMGCTEASRVCGARQVVEESVTIWSVMGCPGYCLVSSQGINCVGYSKIAYRKSGHSARQSNILCSSSGRAN